MRRLMCKNVKNMRDLGGIPTKSGRLIKEYRFLRSNLPIGLSNKEIDFLVQNKIDTVIDLRTKEEIQSKPNDLAHPPFAYKHIQIKGDGSPKTEKEIPYGYISILDDKEKIKKLLTVIAQAPNGVLYNCNAGKDRTGIISMLLLLIADVHEDDIIADYQVSYTYIREEVLKMHLQFKDLPPFLGQSKLEYMEETLNLFKKKYQTIENYLLQIKVDTDTLERIRNKMFD